MSSYQSAYRSGYRRHRRRRRNSHYGVLVLLILLIVIAIPVAYFAVKGLIGLLTGGGGSKNEIVFQVYNAQAFTDGELTDLESAPYVDESGTAVIPVNALTLLGPTVDWDAANNTAIITQKKDVVRVQTGSRTLRLNDETRQMTSAPASTNGITFVPARDVCEALGWKVGLVEEDKGHLLIVSKSKKELNEKKIQKAADAALEMLGPSRLQVMDGCILMRADSDKMYFNGQSVQMASSDSELGNAVITKDEVKMIPLKAAIETLGGTAAADEKGNWTITLDSMESTISAKGKAKASGKTVKGDGISVFLNEANNIFYVSAPLFARLTGRTYNDLADGNGTFAFTKMSLDGYDEQKSYLNTMQNELTKAVGGNIPKADVYVALTFDDGPTGRTDTYPNGYTATLLDELKSRNVHATFFMCGYRIQDFNSHMSRYLEEGHELGNHTMNHPDSRLTGLDAESIREQITLNNDLIESYTGQTPTVMRPVGGGVNETVKEQMKELGLPIINWSLDTQDWQTKTDADSVKNKIISEVEDGDIILMHDIWEGTLPGVLAAIDELQSRTDKTYAFVTVSELAAIHGITLEPGVVYNDLSSATAQAIKDGTYSPTEFE